MTAIKCAVCNADPGGRWKQPAAMIFIDDHQSDSGSKYRCREHLSPRGRNRFNSASKSAAGRRDGCGDDAPQ